MWLAYALGAVGLALGASGVILALVALKAHRPASEAAVETIKGAFKRLEADYERLEETVKSDLGRIARLKRTVRDDKSDLQKTLEALAPAASDQQPIAAPRSRAELYTLMQREKHAG